MKSFKYRLNITKKQEEKLIFTLDHCRCLYNTALQQRRDIYVSTKKSINYYFQNKELPLLKDEFPEYKEIHSQILQDVLARVDLSFKNFFRRVKQRSDKVGYPRFQGKERYDSFTYTQSGFSLTKDKKRVELSKIGLLKVKLHRAIVGDIKTCTVKREGNQWYIIFACASVAIPEKKAVSNAIGIDLGLTDFLVMSNAEEVSNPKYMKQSETKLKEIQSKYSKGKSKKVKRQLANLHRKVARQRRDFQHKLSHKLVNTFDLIAYEDLKIKSMIEDNKYNLQKHIHDASWGQFISMIIYKAENAGKYAIAVNPKGTTQKCSCCGQIVRKNLYERLHTCSCGFSTTRDYNAALNIHKSGIGLVGNSVCTNFVHPFLSSEAPSPLGKG